MLTFSDPEERVPVGNSQACAKAICKKLCLPDPDAVTIERILREHHFYLARLAVATEGLCRAYRMYVPALMSTDLTWAPVLEAESALNEYRMREAGLHE